MYKRLVVVSDTALYREGNQVFGFVAVVKELEFLQDNFEEIIWIGANRPELKDNGTLIEIKVPNIKTILLPKMGGKSLLQVLKILVLYPYLFVLIFKNIYKAEVVHTRLPSHPAFIAVLISYLFPKKIWWNKFAGSWEPTTLPFFYKVQRNLLIKAIHTKVTINGFWSDQPNHCLSFENPCLTQEDIIRGREVAEQKTFEGSYVFSFVGRLEDAKGVSRIIEALKNIPVEKIEKVHFIGSGDDLEKYKNASRFLGEKVLFHGFQNSEKVHQLLAESHFLLLPSASEGFPKVIAEAACYGCIPIVSNVGSIPHYISEKQGFVWPFKNDGSYAEVVREAVQSSPDSLAAQSQSILALAEKFTYASYYKKLVNQVFKS
jgi:glycosyltransferase involved in cell wall biosynthesis